MAKKLSDMKSTQLEKADDSDAEDTGKEGWLRWALGWIVGPGLLIGAIIGLGAHVGANHSDGWFPRIVTWLFG